MVDFVQTALLSVAVIGSTGDVIIAIERLR